MTRTNPDERATAYDNPCSWLQHAIDSVPTGAVTASGLVYLLADHITISSADRGRSSSPAADRLTDPWNR